MLQLALVIGFVVIENHRMSPCDTVGSEERPPLPACLTLPGYSRLQVAYTLW